MERLLTALLLFFTLVFSHKSLASAKINTHVDKQQTGEWRLTYQMSEPVNQLAFIRNPDNSRTTRWQPLDENIEIIFANQQEFVRHKQNKPFSQVSFKLTPVYQHLSKDYAPFSPYSSNGILFHSGRLFACPESCNIDNNKPEKDKLNQWSISLSVPENEHIILDGKVIPKQASWIDSDDGKNIYVGSQTPINTKHFMAVIDTGLPEEIAQALHQDLPAMMNYLQSKFGPLQTKVKPTLFASYSKAKNTSSQGGTLPNQIFMHWDRNDLNAQIKNQHFIYQTLWFFAHEAAHLYQRTSIPILSEKHEESWIHEGQADYVAADVMQHLYPQAKEYVTQKQKQYYQHCAKGLSAIPLQRAAENNQFFLYYTCGYLIHKAIAEFEGNPNTYSLWNQFKSAVLNGAPKGAPTFLDILEKQIGKDIKPKIEHFVTHHHNNPEHAISQLNNKKMPTAPD